MTELNQGQIEKLIYVIRGHKVMLDSDLAELYGVDTRTLNRQVRRNISRFPADFMIEPNSSEIEDLRCQFGTANPTTHWNYMRRTVPMLFTESGIAMLSSVLKSEQAVQVNISIIRIFVRLRSFLAMETSTSDKVNALEKNTTKLFKIVFERMDTLEEIIAPNLSPDRKKIGLKLNQN